MNLVKVGEQTIPDTPYRGFIDMNESTTARRRVLTPKDRVLEC